MLARLLFFGSAASGLAAVISGLYLRSQLRRWRRATGVVIDVIVERDIENGSTIRKPVVRFTPAGSATPVEFFETASSTWSFFRHGQLVDVLYDPANPESATLAGWRQWFLPVFFIVLAIMLAAIGLRSGD